MSSKTNECNLPLFRHRPLDLSQRGIRLLDVLPRDGQSDIRCKIRHVLLSDHDGYPDYEALSYVWGATSSPGHKIIIEGGRYYIHENLYRFLDAHGVHGMSNLFIDAICIDQQNLKEQNHQVGLMSTIFAGASKVIMWLGPGNDFTDELLCLVEAFYFAQRETHPDKSKLNISHHVSTDRRNSDRAIAFKKQFVRRSGQLVAATQHILEHPYWMRTWIIQEMLLAHQLQLLCGKKSLNWHAWVQYMDIFPSLQVGSAVEVRMFVKFWFLVPTSAMKRLCPRWADRSSTIADLLSLVMEFATSECLRVHDKVYALMGLTTDTTNIPIDYEMPAEFLLLWLILPTYEERSMSDLAGLCKIFQTSPSRLMLALDMQGSMQTACMASELHALADTLLKALTSACPVDVTRLYPAKLNPISTVSRLSFQENDSLMQRALAPAFPYYIELYEQNVWKWMSGTGISEYVWSQVPSRVCFCVRCRKGNPAFAADLVRLWKATIKFGYSSFCNRPWKPHKITLLYRNDRTNDYLATAITSPEKGGPMTLFYDPPAVSWPPSNISFSLLNLINLLAHCNHFHSTSGIIDSIDHIVGRPTTPWDTLGS